jgi:hypothetical protein
LDSDDSDSKEAFMQYAKDSFYMALRERLMTVNPSRTVAIGGTFVPAVLVTENLPATNSLPSPCTFYLAWGKARVSLQEGTPRPLIALECRISYSSAGSGELSTDRGRVLAALDNELLLICRPRQTAKQDFTTSPATDLGTKVLWSDPELGEVQGNGGVLQRVAKLTVYFFPEADLS